MMASNTLVLQPPSIFLLPGGKNLGGCPVHLRLLGTRTEDPIDDFWTLIYQHCHVDINSIFSVQSTVDEQLIRAYLNAGLLVVRPERGLLRAWQANFERLFLLPEFQAFYRESELYEIFMHQAVLAGSILSLLNPTELQLFPNEVNYPLHLHSRMRVFRRVMSMDQLVTCRFEDYAEFFMNAGLDEMILIDKPLKDWLQAQS
jgi:hypothetical protein